jgi:hypothetical protein
LNDWTISKQRIIEIDSLRFNPRPDWQVLKFKNINAMSKTRSTGSNTFQRVKTPFFPDHDISESLNQSISKSQDNQPISINPINFKICPLWRFHALNKILL